MGGGPTVVDVVVEGSVVVVVVVVGGGAVVVVVAGAAVVLVVMGGTVVVVLTVEGGMGPALVVDGVVVLVGADPDWTKPSPQPAKTMRTTVLTAMTTDGARRGVLTNAASAGSRMTPWLSLLRLAPLELPTVALIEGGALWLVPSGDTDRVV